MTVLTAAEIADMRLPGLPATRQGVRKLAGREGWPRERLPGSAGAWGYPLASLPAGVVAVIDAELRRRNPAVAAALGVALPPVELQPRRRRSEAPPLLSAAGTARLDARVELLAVFDLWTRQQQPVLAPSAARQLFAGSWNAGLIPAPPGLRKALSTVSEASLRRWQEARTAGEIASLAGRFGGRGRGGEWAEHAQVKRFVLAQTAARPHLTAPQLRDVARAEYGEPLPSLRSFQRLLESWRTQHAQVALSFDSPDDSKSRNRLALGSAEAGIERPNQLWMIDASPQDAILVDGRYSIYVAIDVATRRLQVLVTRTPRTEAVKLLLRRAIIAWGVPERLVTDNGSDFVSAEALRVLAALQIEHDRSTPFSPWEKSFVERAIGTLQHGLMPLLPGYAGHSVAAAQRIRARKTFAARLGESDRQAFEASLSAAEAQELIDAWCEQKYAHQAHGGLRGRTPWQALHGYAGTVRRIDDERALDMLLVRTAGERYVRKKGLRVANRYYWSSALLDYVGTEERLEIRIDPADERKAYVYRIDPLAFVAAAECLDTMTPAALEALSTAEGRRQRRWLAEQRNEVRSGGRQIASEELARMVIDDAARRHANVVSLPAAAVPHRTPALDVAGDAGRAGEVVPIRPAELPPELQAEHEALKRRLAQPAKRIELLSDEDAWFKRAEALERASADGTQLLAQDADWLTWARSQYWYKAKSDEKKMRERFFAGSSASNQQQAL